MSMPHSNQFSIRSFSFFFCVCVYSLFTYFDSSILNGATFSKFYDLLDNYVTSEGTTETFTAAEEAEIEDFLDAIFDTTVMQKTTTYLKNEGERSLDSVNLKEDLRWISSVRKDINRCTPFWLSGGLTPPPTKINCLLPTDIAREYMADVLASNVSFEPHKIEMFKMSCFPPLPSTMCMPL